MPAIVTNEQAVPPDPARGDWLDFLRWYEARFTTSVVDVVEKPWHFGDDYTAYLAAGGLNR